MRLSVSHETIYEYASPVEQAHHVARVRPLDDPRQTVFTHCCRIEPEPSCEREGVDVAGQSTRYFELTTPHTRLRVAAESVVETRLIPGAPSGKLTEAGRSPSMSWRDVVEYMHYRSGQQFDPAREFALASPLAPVADPFKAFVTPLLSDNVGVHALGARLAHRIHTELRYKPAATDVHTSPLSALERREGVCQDFAQIMIACLRSVGLAARYVSGYLLTQPPPGKPRLVGADASHAWVEVYCPRAGWLEMDPTNDCFAGETHVLLARGRDYTDVPPLRGVIRGGGAHELAVAVTVAPLTGAADVSTGGGE